MHPGPTASPPPAFVAHRGFPARYPENSREGLQAAVDAGARYVEFDVQLTRDQEPVLLHDDSFLRTAGIDRIVGDLDAADLDAVDVGEPARFGAEFRGTAVPRLRDIAADLQRWGGVTAFVELKRQSIARFGAAAVCQRVLASLDTALDHCVIISFVHDSLAETRRRARVPIGWVLREWTPASCRLADELAPEYLLVKDALLPPGDAPWPGPWKWICYDITDYDYALQLQGRGIHMISTFDIATMLSAGSPTRQAG